jgi:hypothetical protein
MHQQIKVFILIIVIKKMVNRHMLQEKNIVFQLWLVFGQIYNKLTMRFE